MPLAAVAGTAEIMDLLAPAGPVYQAGTLSGNPTATTAGLVTLQHCTDDVYVRLNSTATQVQAIITDALNAAGVPNSPQRAGNLFSWFFTNETVHNYDEAKTQNTKAFGAFFHSMLQNGVWLPPSAYEAWFVSNAHGDREFEIISAAAPAAALAAASA